MIDIKTFTVPKDKNSSTITIKMNGGGGSASSLKPINLWGQYFDGSQDISGDLSNVANIFANGTLYAPYFNCSGEIKANQITVDFASIEHLSATTHYGEWTISESDDELSDLIIATSTSGHTMRIVPNNIDVLDIDENKVHVNKTLDLTNPDEGSSVVMGTASADADNTNFKSIVESGFYICDNDNNVAIGISDNYIQCGIDIGSANFYSGMQGWRVQPDGTGEFQNLKVNGNLDVFVLTYNEMRATNGILLVTDVGCIENAVESLIDNTKYWVFTINEFPPFAVDDYVQLQYKEDEFRIFSFKGIVTAINQDGRNTVRVLPLSGFQGQGTSTDDRGVTTFSTVDPLSANGEYLIRIGNKTDKNRQTIIKLNPYDGGYIDFMKGLNTESSLAPSTNAPTATRIGNLSGVVYKGTTLEGYGLFSDNAYLTGAIKNLSDKWSLNADGSGQVAGGHISWDSKGNLSIKLGETEITDYISNISNELDGKITSTKTELSGQISATASGLTADYSSKIQTVLNNVNSVSGDLASNYSTTTQMNSSIQASASALTTTFNTKIQTVQSNVNTVSGNLASNYSTTTQMNSAIKASASALTTTFNTRIDTVQSNVNTVSGNLASNYSTTTQMNSSIQASASGVTSTVNKTINEKYTDLDGKITTAKSEFSSEISQTASNIKLEVMNCGVDIDNERIRLNGDTLIEGNLTVEGDGVGFTLAGSGGTTQIISDSIGSWNSFSATSLIKTTQRTSVKSNPSTVSGKYQHTINHWAYFGWVNSGSTVTFNSFDTSMSPTNYSTANNSFTFYIDGTEIGTASYTGIRNTSANKSFTASKSGNLQVRRTMTLTTTTSGQYSFTSYLTVTYSTNAYSKIAYDGMGFNLGNGHHIFCNNTDGVRIGNTSWEQVYTLNGIQTYYPTGKSFNDNGTIRTDSATNYESLTNVTFGQNRVRRITSTGIVYLQPHDQTISIITTNNSGVYLMLGQPTNRTGWNFTLLGGENIYVVADTSGTSNAQKLNAAFIHHFYCDGVYWYYQGGSRTCQFNTSTTHAYG